MTESPTLICTGDIHMGRRPGGLQGRRETGTSANQIWRSLVELALQHQPDAVLLAGDVIDRENKYYEALGPLEDGIRRLGESGIKVIAVSGNHDFDVLPRLEGKLDPDTFELLGQRGEWERTTLERNGESIVHVDGWSYPARRPHKNPLDEYDLDGRDDAPIVGLLHAQLEDLSSPYAHAQTTDLQATHPAAWCVGHEHQTEAIQAPGQPTVLIPGSPQGLDPTETGKHGPWLLELSPGGAIELKHHTLAPLRFEEVTVDVSGFEELDQVEGEILEALTGQLEQCLTENIGLEALSVRLKLEGRTEAHGSVVENVERLREGLQVEREGAVGFIEAVNLRTSPDFDLQELSRGDDPVGVLASRLLTWSDEGSPPEEMPLVRDALNRMQRLENTKPYRVLRTLEEHEEPTADDARRMLLRQGYALLEQMERDKGAPGQ